MNSKRGLIFRAIPDSGKVRIVPNGKGGLQVIWPNCSVLPPDMIKEMEARANTLWFPQAEDSRQKNVNWIVNFCADADEYETALSALAEMVEGTNVPVFNHPKAVAMTRRDIISQKLQGIPNLIVPKCERFLADAPERFQEVFKENNFEYPVLIRPGASQTGQNLVKIDHPDDWRKVHTIPWGGTQLFMTQFIDVISDDGFYKKLRFTFVNGKVLFRSMFQSKGWSVHIKERRTKEMIQRKLDYKQKFSSDVVLKEVLTRIQKRIPLDFWGIDIGFLPDGNFVFFEANASMSIAKHNDTPPELHDLMSPIIPPILSNLRQSLLTPKSWRNNLNVLA